MEQFDLQQQKEWLLMNGFSLEDVAEDDVRVYMMSLGVITFVAELKDGHFTYSSHVSWDGERDNWAMYSYKEFKIFVECLSKLTIL